MTISQDLLAVIHWFYVCLNHHKDQLEIFRAGEDYIVRFLSMNVK